MNDENYQQSGTPLKPSLPAQDPFGTGGKSYVEYATCPRDAPFDDDWKEVKKLADNKLNAFDVDTHGYFFLEFQNRIRTKMGLFMGSQKRLVSRQRRLER